MPRPNDPDVARPERAPRGRALSRRWRSLRRLTAGSLAAVLALLAVDVAWPGVVPPATLLGNLRHLVLPAFVPALLLALRSRRWGSAAASAAALALLGATTAPWWQATASGSDRRVGTIRVVTLNLGDVVADGVSAREVIAALAGDVVLLQEVSATHEAVMSAALRPAYPHQRWRSVGVPGKAVLSRWPIDGESFERIGGRTAIQRARIVVDEPGWPPIEVRNVHLTPPAAWMGAFAAGQSALEAFAESRDEGVLRVVAGDLNTAPWGACVRRLRARGLTDAFAAGRGGAGLTFPLPGRYRHIPLPPLLRLDHVMVGGGARGVAAGVGPDAGSDHLPLWVDLDRER